MKKKGIMKMKKLKIAHRIRKLRKGFKRDKKWRQDICRTMECLAAINTVLDTEMTIIRNFQRRSKRIDKKTERMGELKI